MDTGLEHCEFLSKPTGNLYNNKLKPCLNQPSCFVPNLKEAMPTEKVAQQTGCKINTKASVYIQYECKVSDERLSLKRMAGTLSGCASTFCSLFFMAVLWYMQKMIEISKKEWDLLTVTASDYTLEIPLNEEICAEILQFKVECTNSDGEEDEEQSTPRITTEENRHDWGDIHAPGNRLRNGLADIFNNSCKKKGHKVAEFNFTFNNGAIIEMLMERGTYLTSQEFDKVDEMNRKIEVAVAELAESKDLLIPNAAFVTFEQEKGYNYWLKRGKIKLFE